MAVIGTICLTCGRCGGGAAKPVTWVQDNSHLVCDRCGAVTPIDKDTAAALLARLETQMQHGQEPGPAWMLRDPEAGGSPP